ncbi:energy transducer TonB [Lysobacter sp. CA199]|uniref:energy transducer TonB n=1 Tax=Lysobacter sp. CA199 TaxID=3455608 RepID=UPI003F8D59BD
MLRASAIGGVVAVHAALLFALTLPVNPFERDRTVRDDDLFLIPMHVPFPPPTGCGFRRPERPADAAAIGKDLRVSIRPVPAMALSVPSVLDGLDLASADVGRARFDVPLQAMVSPAPAYPRQALYARQSGSVEIEVVVGADGKPLSARIVRSSGHRALDDAALAAVLGGWRFQPQVRDGEAVQAVARVPIEFVLPAGIARG